MTKHLTRAQQRASFFKKRRKARKDRKTNPYSRKGKHSQEYEQDANIKVR